MDPAIQAARPIFTPLKCNCVSKRFVEVATERGSPLWLLQL